MLNDNKNDLIQIHSEELNRGVNPGVDGVVTSVGWSCDGRGVVMGVILRWSWWVAKYYYILIISILYRNIR